MNKSLLKQLRAVAAKLPVIVENMPPGTKHRTNPRVVKDAKGRIQHGIMKVTSYDKVLVNHLRRLKKEWDTGKLPAVQAYCDRMVELGAQQAKDRADQEEAQRLADQVAEDPRDQPGELPKPNWAVNETPADPGKRKRGRPRKEKADE